MLKKSYILVIALCLCLTGCDKEQVVNESVTEYNETEFEELEELDTEEPTEIIEEVTEVVDEERKTGTVTFCAVGDNLFHKNLINGGLQSDNTYNFDSVYKNIKSYISSFDLSVVNQETVFVDNRDDISSYPCFGTPTEVGDALINTGFDIFLGATNHAYDKGINGIRSTVSYYNKHPEISHVGIYDNEESYNNVEIVEKNNIRIAILNYTYGLNGFVIPENYNYLVNTIENVEKMERDLAYAEENADITIVFPHWGTEYVYEPNEDQYNFAEFLTQNGADVIIGSHPHVVEPATYIESENGNMSLCYFSLGNFVSGQMEEERLLGGIASFNIVKTETDTHIEEPLINPCVTYRTESDTTIYLLDDYTDKLAKKTIFKTSVDKFWDYWDKANESTTIAYWR